MLHSFRSTIGSVVIAIAVGLGAGCESQNAAFGGPDSARAAAGADAVYGAQASPLLANAIAPNSSEDLEMWPDNSGEIAALLQTQTRVGVIAVLRLQILDIQADLETERQIAQAQAQVRRALPNAPVRRVYQQLPLLAVEVNAREFEVLRTNAWVESVQADRSVRHELLQAALAIEAPKARRSFLVDGKGIRVAVIDSGIDVNHPDLKAHIAAQHCFAAGACPPNGGDAGESAQDDNGHGTHVASIIASSGKVSAPGIAPGADIVAVKVLSAKGTGLNSDILAGLDWVAKNAKQLNIRVVNMSLGGSTQYKGTCDKAEAATKIAIHALGLKHVAVFVAAGNDGNATGLSAPACVTGAIAVGATYDADLGAKYYPGLCMDKTTKLNQITCFSNRGKRLAMLAPGAVTTADAIGGGLQQMSGTSQATPVAAGAAVLALACAPALKPLEIQKLLASTGAPITDAATGAVFPLINAFAALQKICPK